MWLPLDGEGALHRQLYRALRTAILEGRLEAGARLPGTRALATELGVSRNTVLQACEQLVAEGYAEGRPRSGTFVRCFGDVLESNAAGTSRKQREPALSGLGRRLSMAVAPGRATWHIGRESLPYDFRYGEPSYDDLPLDTWSRLLGRRARRLSVRRLAYQPPGGAAELREALAGYLARARGVVCDAAQIIIVHGSQQAIDLSMRLLVDVGDGVTQASRALSIAARSSVRRPSSSTGT
jgi:GntR family transcriptional regulator/MocR family aminotransferase